MMCNICGAEYLGENETEVIKAHKEFWHNPWFINQMICTIEQFEEEVKSE